MDQCGGRCPVGVFLVHHPAEISFNKMRSFRFVAYILQKLSLSQLANQSFRIEGDAKSFNKFVEIWELKHNVRQRLSASRLLIYTIMAGQLGGILQTYI